MDLACAPYRALDRRGVVAMMWSPRKGAVVSALALVLLVAACGNASSSGKSAPTNTGSTVTTFTGTDFTKNVPVNAPGVSSTEIHVGAVTSKTNPVGGDPDNLNVGIKAYFDHINSQGGIYGRKLKLTSERDDATVQNSTQVQAMLSQDNVYAAFMATELFSGSKLLAKAGIPTFGWNINPEWAGPDELLPERRAPVLHGLRTLSARHALDCPAVEGSPGRGRRVQRPAIGGMRERQRRQRSPSSARTSTRRSCTTTPRSRSARPTFRRRFRR